MAGSFAVYGRGEEYSQSSPKRQNAQMTEMPRFPIAIRSGVAELSEPAMESPRIAGIPFQMILPGRLSRLGRRSFDPTLRIGCRRLVTDQNLVISSSVFRRLSMTSMMNKRTRSVLAACVAAVACGSVWAAVKQDNFDNNTVAAFWTPFNASTAKVKETSQRLAFRSTSDTAGLRRAGYQSNGWTYRGEENSVTTFDFKVDVAGLTGSESAGVGVYTIEPDEGSALEVQVVQKANGNFIQYRLFVDQGSGLTVLLSDIKPINVATGSVEMRFNKVTDKLIIKVNGQTKITVDDLTGGGGTFDLDVELFGWSKKTSFGYGDVWIDNFRLQATID
jgi:hypothetical protein